MNLNKQKRPKLRIHTTNRDLKSLPPQSKGRVPFLIVAVIVIVMITKFMPAHWLYPIPAKTEPVTVSIDREPAPVVAEPLVKEIYGPPAPPEPVRIPSWQRHAVPVEMLPGKIYIAIVIDDMGVNVAKSLEMVAMPSTLTLAFLPYARGVAEMAAQGRANGHELMVHIPMEPLDVTINAGDDVLRTSQPPDDLIKTIEANLSKFPDYVGINNHMGSKFTQDVSALETLMGVLKERELLLLDSKTIAGSKAYALAVEAGIPALERDVFLDDDPSLVAVKNQLNILEKIAARKGHAIAIGHPKVDTLQALREWLPTLDSKNIQIVPLSALAKNPAPESGVQAHPQPSAPQPEPYEPSPDIQTPDHLPQ